ncbi:hypothetical protein P9Y62_21800 [Bacillus thuringiensis]|uniref:Uncharacterized protein n=1 Tax=Bacillus thuringiensis HD-771 TaxID=1218175 RepID=A0A9W3JGX4_BACTU|nr:MULTISPECIES: hypothetical protein [Bacillus cereus group]EEM38606.1 hypothetical protein bthur0004_55040 [Bacillus thuringiensis serovar sotto str. T04001]AFQ19918.1 hypothetical protein BTG_32933 [Bacillus thuringiensis HD-771]KZD53308.1 hypothetical protein B4084_0021 [Bacillus cereus]MEB4894556.1 hypothetical protein [Bacillus thuringiensis]MEC2563944.1 hypothetical protein [Bacillus thuringiensis]
MTSILEKMMNTGTEITILGEKVTMRRLNVTDVWRFAKIISKVGRSAIVNFADFGKDKQAMDELTKAAESLPEEEKQAQLVALKEKQQQKGLEFAFRVLTMIPACEDDFTEFFASLLKVKAEEFRQFPSEAMVSVIQGLLESEDLMTFFNQVKGLVKVQSEKWSQSAAAPILA